ncbi:rubredoxin-like domain-containing protein [Anaerosphaera aminiphila]|nr:rubredoxin [Anaerosphaera aminiphila]
MKWECVVCGYIHEGDMPPEFCPICGVGREKFIIKESDN